MAFHVRDHDTDTAVRKLAKLKRRTLTDTIREAVEREFAEITAPPPLIDRLQAIQADFQALRRPGGQTADKAFFDELSGDA